MDVVVDVHERAGRETTSNKRELRSLRTFATGDRIDKSVARPEETEAARSTSCRRQYAGPQALVVVGQVRQQSRIGSMNALGLVVRDLLRRVERQRKPASLNGVDR